MISRAFPNGRHGFVRSDQRSFWGVVGHLRELNIRMLGAFPGESAGCFRIRRFRRIAVQQKTDHHQSLVDPMLRS